MPLPDWTDQPNVVRRCVIFESLPTQSWSYWVEYGPYPPYPSVAGGKYLAWTNKRGVGSTDGSYMFGYFDTVDEAWAVLENDYDTRGAELPP
jgi:hypothetical protein